MDRHCQYCAFPIAPGAERDVDRDRLMATRNVLERANLLFEGYFRALYAPLYALSLWHR